MRMYTCSIVCLLACMLCCTQGCPNGRQFKFDRAADELPGYETGDVIVMVVSV